MTCMKELEDSMTTTKYVCGMQELSVRIVGGNDADNGEYGGAGTHDPDDSDPADKGAGHGTDDGAAL